MPACCGCVDKPPWVVRSPPRWKQGLPQLPFAQEVLVSSAVSQRLCGSSEDFGHADRPAFLTLQLPYCSMFIREHSA